MNDRLENLTIQPDQKRAILQVIDVKINNDMKEVIAEIRQLEKIMDVKFQATQDKIQMVHDKLSNEIKVVYWVVGIAMSVILFIVAKK
ncbi:MAG TPA: hypothetical protein VGS79_20755 [Puia sp.]|nr:hypothetical protein [Puia sp.]